MSLVLVDTSVWVHHLGRGDGVLAALLGEGRVVAHPFVCGEMSLGVHRGLDDFLVLLRSLPAASCATDDEVLFMVKEKKWQGKGLGWVDCHLLASALLGDLQLLTHDKALMAAAERVGCGMKG